MLTLPLDRSGWVPDPGEAWYYVMLMPQRDYGWREVRRGLFATKEDAEADRASMAKHEPTARFTRLMQLPLWEGK